MELNAILEIIISLVALFWLMSTGCSFVVEAANSLLLNIRAKALERFICEMVLGSNKVPQLRNFAQFWRRSNLEFTRGTGMRFAGSLADPLGLFSHGLIQALRKPQNIPGGNASPPSYVPASAFGQALLDRLLSVSWAVQCDPVLTRSFLAALALPPAWAARLAAAQTGAGAGAPLLNAVLHLLKEIHGMPLHRAQTELQALIRALHQQPVTDALKALPATNAMPGLADVDGTPLGLRDLLTGILVAAEQALAALAQSRGENTGTATLSSLVSVDALWLLSVRKAGEALTHNPVLMDTIRDIVHVAPLPVSLREALRPIVAAANFDPDKLQKGIEVWYDAVMERATGWFKRYTTVLLGVFGLVAAVSLNVNTIRVAQDLSTDPALRNAGVAFADFVVRERGRPQLVQQYGFALAADKLGWRADVAGLDAEKEAVDCNHGGRCMTEQLYLEMYPRLLTSGRYAGAAVLMSAPKNSLAPYRPDGAVEFRKRLCVSAREITQEIQKEQAAVTSQGKGKSNEWFDQPECQWIVKDFGKGTNPAPARPDDVAKFWANGNVVWNEKFASALRTAYDEAMLTTTTDDAAREKLAGLKPAISLVKTEFNAALANAQYVEGQAKAYLDRIPSVGRPTGGPRDADWLFPGGWLVDIIGWAITAIMISFGASFWFDLLSNLVDRRATGPKPDQKVM
jgi:hypothetical protein